MRSTAIRHRSFQPTAQPHRGRADPGRRAALLGTAAVLAATRVSPARAAGPPLRAARVLVGFPPGAATDGVARLLAERLRGRYAAAVVVENRPGAGGRLALEAAKAAEPDGATLVFTPSDMLTIYPHVYGARLRYDPLADFAPVAAVARFHLALAAGPATPAGGGLAEVLARARGQAPVPFGVPGAGTFPHFLGLQLAQAAGVALMPVVYRGGAPSVQDLIAGQIPLAISALGDFVPQLGSGRVRLLAVASPERLPGLPAVPTFAEEGFGALTLAGWWGVLLPAHTPALFVQALDQALAEAVAHPETREGVARFGAVPFHEGPAALSARVARETSGWAPIVANSGFRAED